VASRTRPSHPYADAPRLPEPTAESAAVPLEALLGGPGPYELEIGPGRGVFCFERLAAAPEVRLLGLEIRLKWAKIVDDRLRAAGLGGRARVLAADAREALPRLMPSGAVRAAFLHFPDPWWKKRHEKRLVFQEGLLEELVRLLEPGGVVFVQTDVEHRVPLYEAAMSAHGALEPFGDVPGSPMLAENPYGARSPREKRAIADGIPIHRLRFRKRA
jgi:tRNA (guanine-N7-)-methyltransferase